MRHIVIIGFESAGLTAASAARMADRTARITVIERRSYAVYHPCGIPFAIGGEVPDIGALVEPAPPLTNVDVRTATEAIALDTRNRTVEVSAIRARRPEMLEYDSLVLATGSYAFKPPVPGIDLGNVHPVKTIEDGRAIIAALRRAKRVAVIGAGPIGIETAAALRERGLGVTIVEALPSVMPGMLDPDMADLVAKLLRGKGIDVLCGRAVQEILGDGRARSIVAGGRELPADLVIIATGVRPEVQLAREAGIELGESGGIRVDKYLRTSAAGVYAAGDCAEGFCLITGRPILSQLATTAIRMGKVAGTNAAGGEAIFEGTLNTVVVCAYGLEIASTGLTTHSAREAGISPIAGRVRAMNRPRYYPGAEPIVVKLLVEPSEHRIIGGQVLSTEGTAERINLLALAIKKGMTVEELAQIEYCYAPPVSDCIEPLVVAAEAILRRL